MIQPKCLIGNKANLNYVCYYDESRLIDVAIKIIIRIIIAFIIILLNIL